MISRGGEGRKGLRTEVRKGAEIREIGKKKLANIFLRFLCGGLKHLQ